MVQQSRIQLRAFAPKLRKGSFLVRWGPPILLLVLSYISADSSLFLFGSAVFIFFYSQFFNVQVPPVILFLFFFQWFFNQGQLVHALTDGSRLAENFRPGNTINTVFYLGMIGTAAFFLGIYFWYRKIRIYSFEHVRQLALQLYVDKLLAIFLATYPLLGVAVSAVWLFPGLTQPLVMLTYFKWSLFFILFVVVFTQKKHKAIMLSIIAFEFVIGFASFWASFKDVVYVSFISYWIFYFKGNVVIRWTLIVGVVVMVYIGSLWSVVKQDYRNFLNAGTGAQGSVVSRGEALDKFTDMVSAASPKDIEEGFDVLILRMSWIGAFNRIYNHVPSKIPHEEGKLWTSGVTRPFMPRLLFPEKSSLSDSEELNYYSGLHVESDNTSISMSTIAGSYVDFGIYNMHIPLLLFGFFVGWVYKKVFDMSANFLFGHALTIPLIFLVNINEQSINREVSSVVLYLLVVWFICKFLQRPLLRFITKPGR